MNPFDFLRKVLTRFGLTRRTLETGFLQPPDADDWQDMMQVTKAAGQGVVLLDDRVHRLEEQRTRPRGAIGGGGGGPGPAGATGPQGPIGAMGPQGGRTGEGEAIPAQRVPRAQKGLRAIPAQSDRLARKGGRRHGAPRNSRRAWPGGTHRAARDRGRGWSEGDPGSAGATGPQGLPGDPGPLGVGRGVRSAAYWAARASGRSRLGRSHRATGNPG